uniref:Transposase (Putative), gypsy type n=1 Tax=Tanacetum cinerariifolium TaxID=118510 RepID=A0A6L2JKR1_TANCI|nr:hypothetical protein [Tanacetum cinerariifolium]
MLLQLTRDRVVPLAGVNDKEVVNVQGAGDNDVNEGDGDATEANQTEQGELVIDVGGIDVVADDEVQAIVADKPKRIRKKRRAANGAGVAPLQSLLERSTLHVEVGVAAAATVPFVTSSVTHDSISGTGLRTRHPAKSFVISSDSSHDLNANATDDEVTSVIRSSVPPPPVLTAAIATTIAAGVTSELSAGSFYVSQDMDPETLWQLYIPKWNVINDFVLDNLDVFRGMIDHLAPLGFFSQLRGMDYEQLLADFIVGTVRQVCFSAEIRRQLEHELRASLKALLSLKEVEAAEAIRLRGQAAVVEVAEATRTSELNGLKERNAALEEQVAALESAAASKVVELASSNAQVAKVTQDLSSLQVSCDELTIKTCFLEFEKYKLIDQVSALEITCSGLRDEVMGYKLFKDQMALHIDEEFYPRYLTTIAGQRWILSRDLKLAIMKCLRSPEYLAALGGVISRAINKGMQDGLAVGIDHGKARRGLVDVSAYNTFAKADYVTVINAFRTVDFPILAQMESLKDATMVDIMDLLCLEGHAAETLEASQLQPLPEQLMIPIYRLEDQVVIRETSMSFSLDVAHTHAQRIKGDAEARCLSFTDVMVPLIEPLSAKSLIGEASASRVLKTAMTTALSTTFIQSSTVPLVRSIEVPPSLKVMFEQEELDTTPEHTLAP